MAVYPDNIEAVKREVEVSRNPFRLTYLFFVWFFYDLKKGYTWDGFKEMGGWIIEMGGWIIGLLSALTKALKGMAVILTLLLFPVTLPLVAVAQALINLWRSRS